MRKFVAGHVTKTWFLNYELPLSDANFALKLHGKCWKDDVLTFIAHLNVTIEHLTRYKQKLVLAAMLEGKSMPSNIVVNTIMLLCWKIKVPSNTSLKCISSQISGVRELLCALSIFGISRITTHCLKEALVKWPLSARGLLQSYFDEFIGRSLRTITAQTVPYICKSLCGIFSHR